MKSDVGKRVHLVGDILQVENEAQRANRVKHRIESGEGETSLRLLKGEGEQLLEDGFDPNF